MDAFHAHAGQSDGRHPWCRDCRSALGKAERLAKRLHAQRAAELAKDGLKACSTCAQVKGFEDFYRRSVGPTGRKSQCIACYRDGQRAYNATEHAKRRKRVERTRRRAQDPERYDRLVRAAQFKSKYGITLAHYEQMLADQGGCCAVCGLLGGDWTLLVDHCHTTGRVRGLLCRKCNSGIGMLGDSAAGVQQALSYLMRR
jgi:hypothetical protein